MASHRFLLLLALGCLCGLAAVPMASAAPPRAKTLGKGWTVRTEPAAPADPQQPPPEETAPEGTRPASQPTGGGDASQGGATWQRVPVPSVFDGRALPRLYPGMVRRYRLTFRAPPKRGFRWLIAFESVRRGARVYLNGRRIGYNPHPYTPFAFEARGLKPGKRNRLTVIVDNRKDPRLLEGWWNWGGIVRPVKLIPVGRAHLRDIGLMSKVRCKRRGRACRARVLLDADLERRGRRRIKPLVSVTLRSPRGRMIRKTFKLPRQRARKRRLRLSLRVPRPELWSPRRPRLYSARVVVRDRGRVQQLERKRIGLRSVQVKRGRLYLNNKPLQLRGASIHEDFPGKGPALSRRDMSQTVAELKELGANVTRAHYLLNERLLAKLDRAGIMVWNQAPIWQRDHKANLLKYPSQRRRALLSVRRTVEAARSHPSVITHSVANELSFTPDYRRGTRRFLVAAARYARDLDPTIPISVDIKGRAGFPRQSTYSRFDMLGINQYFGWYRWVSDFNDLAPYLAQIRRQYRKHALVMTEFGAEARPELANAPGDRKGGYAFQAAHVDRTLDVVDRSSALSGAIHWTLREFEIYPGWTGGAGRRAGQTPNTRHHKGLLDYFGAKKPAWHVARDHFLRVPRHLRRP